MKKLRALLFATAAVAISATSAQALDGVVASIKPLHSLVAGVMEGVGEPQLIVRGAGSPHTYTMRPSEAAALERAKLVFWVGPDLEVFLARPLETLASGAAIVELGEADGVALLDYREGGPFEAHSHGPDDAEEGHGHDHGHSHDHEDDDEEEEASHDHGHDHSHDDDHAHEAAHDHAHHDGHDHAHGAHDMHVWLDPENARAMVHAIEHALAEADPANASAYAANAERLEARIDELKSEIEAELGDVRDQSFVVFHDAYQYFENRFGLAAAGSITVSPEVMPGAARIDEMRGRVRDLGVACVFAEPQFDPRLVEVVAEGTPARAGVLDPLGADLADGPDLYFELMRNLTSSLAGCLRGEG